jgi:hypothetical protein
MKWQLSKLSDTFRRRGQSNVLRDGPGHVCFCTLAIHAPYRQRARQLCSDAPAVPWIVLTDEPGDFEDLPVRAIRHAPTGPMAVDYLTHLPPTGNRRGAAAYHDKRFALLAALQDFETAIYVDADSRINKLPRLRDIPSGLAVLPDARESIAEHFETFGPWRGPVFLELARHLTGDDGALHAARWCPESAFAVTRDGRESRFFDAWGRAAAFLQARGVYSGEGAVIGLAAMCAGWRVNNKALKRIGDAIQHEGGGPKRV